MLIVELRKKGLIAPPKFLEGNLSYLTTMGSDAYGASSDASDLDVYGFCVPVQSDVFPHIKDGYIHGFGAPPNPFSVWTQHHIKDGDKEYDLTVYSLIKYFNMAMDASPNIVDSLFVPRRCILHTTSIGTHVRENRKLFLSKKLRPKLLGYAYTQLGKLRNGNTPLVQFIRSNGLDGSIFLENGALDHEQIKDFSKKDELVDLANKFPIKVNSRRREDIIRNSYSTKEGYHVARLGLQCEQVLTEHDLDLERNAETLKEIRRGEWTFEHLVNWFEAKEKALEALYETSTLAYSPDEKAIRRLLMECLEMHYGSVPKAMRADVPVDDLVRELQDVLDKYR